VPCSRDAATGFEGSEAGRCPLERERRLVAEIVEHRLEQDQNLSHIAEREALKTVGETSELRATAAARPALKVASVVS
jgi:hypothetical protein